MRARARGLASAGKYLDNSEYIRKKSSMLESLRERLDWKTALIIGVVVIILAYRMGWVG